jgi:tetratricopeptide (TPR) repeat protein
MSPEQFMDSKSVDERSDLYSVGCVLFEMLTGKPPYTGDSAFEIAGRRMNEPLPELCLGHDNLQIPAALAAIVRHSLERAPQMRFQTAQEFAQALSLFERDPNAAPLLALQKERGGSVQSGSMKHRRRLTSLLTACAAILLSMIGVAFSVLRSQQDVTPLDDRVSQKNIPAQAHVPTISRYEQTVKSVQQMSREIKIALEQHRLEQAISIKNNLLSRIQQLEVRHGGLKILALIQCNLVALEAKNSSEAKGIADSASHEVRNVHPSELLLVANTARQTPSFEMRQLAVKLFSRIIQESPHDAEAYLLRARVEDSLRPKAAGYALLKHGERAADDYARAIELGSKDRYVYADLVNVLNRLNRLDSGLKFGLQAVKLYPDEPANLVALGQIYVSSKKYAEAAALFTKALSSKQNFDGILLARANAYRRDRQYDKALQDLRLYAQRNPRDQGFALSIAKYFWNIGRYDDSRKEYDHLAEIFPDNAEIWVQRGLLRWSSQKDREGAWVDFNTAIKKGSKNSDCYTGLGHIARERGDGETAFRYYNRGAQLKPDSGWAHRGLAFCYANKGQFRKSLAELELTEKWLKRDVDYYIQHGRCLKALGLTDAARNDFIAAIKLSGGEARVRSVCQEAFGGDLP